MKPFDFLGYRIEYSQWLKRWRVCGWDCETGHREIGPTHPSKWAAMDWCAERSI